METDLIIVREYCQKSHVDPSFIVSLEEDGLIFRLSMVNATCLVRNYRTWNDLSGGMKIYLSTRKESVLSTS